MPLMARQLAAFHPLSYALWYEHCAGMNPDLSRVLDSRLAANTALTEADVWRLYAQHIAARDMEAFERLQLQLRNLLEDNGFRRIEIRHITPALWAASSILARLFARKPWSWRADSPISDFAAP